MNKTSQFVHSTLLLSWLTACSSYDTQSASENDYLNAPTSIDNSSALSSQSLSHEAQNVSSCNEELMQTLVSREKYEDILVGKFHDQQNKQEGAVPLSMLEVIQKDSQKRFDTFSSFFQCTQAENSNLSKWAEELALYGQSTGAFEKIIVELSTNHMGQLRELYPLEDMMDFAEEQVDAFFNNMEALTGQSLNVDQEELKAQILNQFADKYDDLVSLSVNADLADFFNVENSALPVPPDQVLNKAVNSVILRIIFEQVQSIQQKKDFPELMI